jgi:four helix bundle protein
VTKEELKERFRKFCIRTITFADTLPKFYSAQVVVRQIVRSSTSSTSNYHAACRSKSIRDFINKLKIVEEELDETDLWLSVIRDAKFSTSPELNELKQETNEMLSIIVASIKTARNREQSRN